MAMFEFTLEERDRRWNNVRQAMGKRGLGALVVWGSFGSNGTHNANLRYLSNVNTEGYLVFPLEGEPALITFVRKRELVWVTDWRSGHPMYAKAISDRLRELHLENTTVGVVGLSGYYGEMGFPYTAYLSLIGDLPGAHFEDATDIVETTRRVKSNAEISCFELGCEVANKVIQAIVDTAKAGVKDYEVRTKIMNNLFQTGCDPNSMVLYYSGKEVFHAGQGGYLQPPGAKSLEEGDVILTEFDARYLGYKAQHNQPFSVGQPNKEWRSIFAIALEAFNNGLEMLKPGITAGELDEAFLSPIRKSGYTYRNPAFHGIGLALEEPIGSFPAQPAYKPDTSLVIEAGMVFEFEPHVVTSDGKKGLTLGCPVLVTKTGCRLLNERWTPEFRVT